MDLKKNSDNIHVLFEIYKIFIFFQKEKDIFIYIQNKINNTNFNLSKIYNAFLNIKNKYIYSDWVSDQKYIKIFYDHFRNDVFLTKFLKNDYQSITNNELKFIVNNYKCIKNVLCHRKKKMNIYLNLNIYEDLNLPREKINYHFTKEDLIINFERFLQTHNSTEISNLNIFNNIPNILSIIHFTKFKTIEESIKALHEHQNNLNQLLYNDTEYPHYLINYFD